MATWDNADLLARFKRDAGIPTTTAFPLDADIYAWLTRGQAYWYDQFATHCPWILMGAPTLLTTADSGETYTFPSSDEPMAVELYDTKAGRLMRPGGYWDPGAEYVWEGNKIRFPKGITKTFTDGPYARYISLPGDIDGSTQPTLVPARARVLIIDRALIFWAKRGGKRDPRPFIEQEQTDAWGSTAGDVGILGALKNQNPFYGAIAHGTSGTLTGLEFLDTGSGYRQIP